MADASSLIAAIRAGDLAAVEAAVAAQAALACARDAAGVSMICIAVYSGRDEIARALARGRNDLDVFEASCLGDAERVRKLISSDPALVNACSPDGFQPLGYACFFGRRRVFDLLLDAGAEVEAPARNAMQVRPLHSAVAQSDPEIALDLARRLLEAGASPNFAQQRGFTPLHEAALRGHLSLVSELLRHGADASARNADGQTPADLAHAHGHQAVSALLAHR